MTDMKQFVIDSWGKDAVAGVLSALSAVENCDLDYLESKLDDGGRGRYWKSVIADLRKSFELCK